MSERRFQLGDLQLRIMRVLWRMRTATVAEVHGELTGDLAYTTVATMLRKMEERGLVDHEERGRKFVYRSLISEDEVSTTLANDLVDHVFDGSVTATVHQLLRGRDVDGSELDEIQRLIDEHRRRNPAN